MELLEQIGTQDTEDMAVLLEAMEKKPLEINLPAGQARMAKVDRWSRWRCRRPRGRALQKLDCAGSRISNPGVNVVCCDGSKNV